ncbi:hypothetical protein An11g01560 [Aspergillus niger]|uniref:Uncharacterized protein n=2 Tax=Aspergillus niger TaxID=5061 RepID=A2QVI6_ASPNC|nr:hypothetical protein An11g01560 [Aspergillus niger]CAK45890.1 hypothetical protein An11g01560 [Aspergillus niger]
MSDTDVGEEIKFREAKDCPESEAAQDKGKGRGEGRDVLGRDLGIRRRNFASPMMKVARHISHVLGTTCGVAANWRVLRRNARWERCWTFSCIHFTSMLLTCGVISQFAVIYGHMLFPFQEYMDQELDNPSGIHTPYQLFSSSRCAILHYSASSLASRSIPIQENLRAEQSNEKLNQASGGLASRLTGNVS